MVFPYGGVRRSARLPAFCLFIGLLTQPIVSQAHFLFLPTAQAGHESHPFGNFEKNHHDFIGDFFYSNDWERLRFLGELQISREERDMERLQVGWRASSESSLWFGRFHSPISLWNTEHHHGRYLETSVGRPTIVEFEDNGGPLPVHLTGLLLESTHPVGDGVIQIDTAVASGPKFENQLEPIDVIRKPRFNDLALALRAVFRPEITRDTRYGLMFAQTRIPAKDLSFNKVLQNVVGFATILDLDPLRVLGEAFRIDHRVLDGSPNVWPSYSAGYAQLEYKIAPGAWTAYARFEGISTNLNPDYRAAFPDLAKQKHILGLRWDFYRNQALKLQVDRITQFDGPTSRGVEIQWSALFP